MTSGSPSENHAVGIGLRTGDASERPAPATTITATVRSDSGALVKIGRYRLVRVLGEGGYGRVWLGQDEELRRYVAIKVPTPERFREAKDAETYLAEARTLASLDHPNIVPVYDVGKADDGSIYVVSKFIEGSDLARRIKEARPSHSQAAALAATIAQALQHAHQKRLIHRDIKPANILIDEESDRPYLTDFGLALREEDFAGESGLAGTPAYMSPEQARGEGHRLDGRSDIFSLGVVFYELLTGKRPFRGSTAHEVLHQITSVDPPAPREHDPAIPAELERICLKALAKRASVRYATAADLADELLHWSQVSSLKSQVSARIVPKGLRSFDAEDADFFLDLLPGPRDRDGLPESIRFWKTRIEETDPDETFTVGLLYGPSGCGKSSLVKAGLLPRLAGLVITVYVEATAEETEARILRGLRKQLPELPDGGGLVESFIALRRGLVPAGKKVLIVLDQFEQWLHAKRRETNTDLVAALRHCDGARLQAVCMVRDDFWMAASRFMGDVDVPILQGHNVAAVDLFNLRHAEKVLGAFGRAFGDLEVDLTPENHAFLERSVTELAEDGKVVCVRLALFGEMVKGKSWTPATLEQLGGTEGIGVSFLEETFISRTANPKHRLHQQAAREVLKALLPEVGTDIKGTMRSHAELLGASGYADRPRDFADLLRILDGELRLITPTDPEGATTASGKDPSSKYYQLAHDYLVPSLREWLTRKQKETRRGRAELCLAERAALWAVKSENRHLPAWWEHFSIRLFTRKRDWTDPQRRMMRQASRYHGVRTALLLLLAGALTLSGVYMRDRVVESQQAERAGGLVNALLAANIEQVPGIIADLADYRHWADPQLRRACQEYADDARERLHASLALLPVDLGQIDYLKGRLLAAEPADVAVLREALGRCKNAEDAESPGAWPAVVGDLWRVLERPTEAEQRATLPAAAALALYEPESDRWHSIASKVGDTLVAVNPVYLGRWIDMLRPVRGHLIAPLSAVYRNAGGKRSESQVSLATNILEDYAADRPDVLAELVMDAQPGQFLALYPKLAALRDPAVNLLEQEIVRRLSPSWNDAPLEASWPALDPAWARQIEASHGILAERFAFVQTMPPEAFVQVAEVLRKSGYRPIRLRPYPRHSPHSSSIKGDGILVAAVWTRDGLEWQLAHGLSADELRKQDSEYRKKGFQPGDVGAYLTGAEETYAAVWLKPAGKPAGVQMELGLNQSQLEAREAALTKEGYRRATSSHLARPDGKDRFAAIWLKVSERAAEPVGVYSGVEPEYSGDNYLADLQVDVQVSRASPPRSTKERFAEQLAEAEKQLKAKAEDTPARLRRALARLHLGDSEKALEDLSWLIGKSPKYALAYLHRAEVHSRLGKTKEAKEDLARFQELSTDAGQKAYADAVVSAFLGEDAAGMKRLEAGIAANGKDADFLYNAACACAVASRALVGKDGAKAKRYSDRALALIKEAVANGYTNYLQMQTDPNLDPLREQPAFTQLLQVGRLERHYLAVWHPVAGFRSTEVHGLDPDQHLARCRSLVTQGYRPAAISGAFVSSSLVGDDKGGGSIVSASVWHQPLVPEEHKEALAKRQANAAVALVRLGHGEKVWPLLKHSPDPRVRSGIIHRLSPMGAAPEVLAQRLDEETDVTIRRALLLSLGEYPSVSPVDQNLLAAKLLELYRDDPDPGIHGACAWVLRRWGHSTKLAQTDAELAKRPHPTLSKHSALAPQASSLKSQATGHAPQASSLKPQATGHAPQASSLKPQATGHAPQVSHPAPQASSRRWYVNSQGQTFVIIPGPVEFLMGSPRSEAERERGAEGPIERLHKKRIGRTFAIASHEVTVEQFLRFRREHRYRPQYANQPDCPMNDVSWYDAAAYCNWLSEQEGIPKDQWCYEPNAGGQYAEGMKPKPRYLQLTGYRLPSESEWEYACRSGAATARFYGETEELLGQYAWYTKNSLDRWLLPVGSLKPNEFGLFDMLGNALEWCQDPIFDYRLQRAGRSTEDQEFAGDIRDTQLRVLRGGAFSHRPRGVRSGNRLRYQPADRLSNVGFRLARTYD